MVVADPGFAVRIRGSQPVIFGVHGAVAEHYKVPPNVSDPHATTLDYIVAATAG